MRIYLSIQPKGKGGGSNTFAGLFKSFAQCAGHRIVERSENADLAIIIAHLAEEEELKTARRQGCIVLHRLDEYFETDETPARREKHEKIISLNRLADITIYQSHFVFENAHPYLKASKYRIVHNGGDRKRFKPAATPGRYIGHVSWGIDGKKRLDLLYEFMCRHSEQQFLLVGRHREHALNFKALPNANLAGAVSHWRLPGYYRKMKMLYFPSERDPCPNTVVEAILSGVPVCYNSEGGGSVELTRDCGAPLEHADSMLPALPTYRERCLRRDDLSFESVFQQYMDAAREVYKGEASGISSK